MPGEGAGPALRGRRGARRGPAAIPRRPADRRAAGRRHSAASGGGRRRNPTLAATTAALVLAFALGTPTLFGLWLRARADHARACPGTERDRAERSRDRAISAVGLLLRNDR